MVKVELKWNKSVQSKLKSLPLKIVQEVAADTLGKAYPTIPMSSALERNLTRGRLRRETMAKGVQTKGTIVYLESPTYYANYVYNMNNNTTNWSTPGTGSKWFDNTWKKQGKQILDRAVERNKL